MKPRTKWIIGISSAIALGITAFATKKYWIPLFKKKSLTNSSDEYSSPVKPAD